MGPEGMVCLVAELGSPWGSDFEGEIPKSRINPLQRPGESRGGCRGGDRVCVLVALSEEIRVGTGMEGGGERELASQGKADLQGGGTPDSR